MRFLATSLSNADVSFERSGDALKVNVLAITPGTELPLRDADGKAVASFVATSDLIKSAISSFRGGIFNVDHDSIPETMIGTFDSVSYKDGYFVSGSILCPQWKERILAGTFKGVSAEGFCTGDDITNPDSFSVYAVSFLTDNPGACPLADSACRVDLIMDEEKIEAAKIEAAWVPNYNAFWSYIETDGKINQAKAKKIFLKKTGDGTNRGNWHYPTCKMTENGPVDSDEGLMTAYKRAAQQGETGLFSKIRSRMRKIGMEIPEGLKASKSKLEASFDKESGKFSAKMLDEDDEIISEVQIINDLHVKGAEMLPKSEEIVEVKVEAKVEASAETLVEAPTEPIIEAKAPEVVAEAPTIETPTAPVAEVPAAVVVEQPKTLDWDVIKTELGLSSKDDFEQMRTTAQKYAETQAKLDEILKETESLRAFKIDKQKAYLKEMYPPALTKNIDAFYADYVKDPLEFTQKYAEDATKFAGSKNVVLAGSAAESQETEKTRREAEIKGAVTYLYKKNGRSR
jgi:hypothetical protein